MKRSKVLMYATGGIVIALVIGASIYLLLSTGENSTTVEPVKAALTPSQSTISFPYTLITILSLTTLASVGISFYLYYWRKILLADDYTAVPEKWAKSLIDIRKGMDEFRADLTSGMNYVANETNNNTTKLSSMIETHLELQSALDDRDKEIKRLKSGYDAEIFRRFISRFIRIDQTVDDFIIHDGATESLSQIQRLFEDALDECGVSKFEPSVGNDYRKTNGIADNPKTKPTDKQDEDFRIVEILETGYQINTNIGNDVIIPAKVRIFRFKEE